MVQQFSTNSIPVSYYQVMKDEKAIKRKEYIDIYNIGGVNLKDYDMFFTDIDYNILQDEISTLAGFYIYRRQQSLM